MKLVFVVLGALGGTFVEYVVHRWLLHRLLPVFHAVHHNAPDDTSPGIGDLAVMVVTALAAGASFWLGLGAFGAGVVLWYGTYAFLHMSFHLNSASFFAPPCLQRRHDDHHKYYDCNYGVVTPLWDKLFGTACPPVRTITVRDYEPGEPHVCANARGGRRCDTCFGPVP